MSSLIIPVEVGAYIIGIIGSFSAIYAFLKYGNYVATVKLQNDSIKALEDNNKILKAEIEQTRANHLQSVKMIGTLEGKIASYKEIPLQSIADSLNLLSEGNKMLNSTNEKILSTLKNSAVIAATDRDTLLNPVQNVTEQTVEHQTIKSKQE